jgi:transcriptional regulator with XRE-family HTH domain
MNHATLCGWKGTMKGKSGNPIDKHVGARVRMRRMMLKMSQTKLGDALGLTFQQVQKYEKGVNRIGAGRLLAIAGILQVPVEFFFEGAPQASQNKHKEPVSDYVQEFLSTKDGLALTKAFTQIKQPALRRAIVHLVEEIASDSV